MEMEHGDTTNLFRIKRARFAVKDTITFLESIENACGHISQFRTAKRAAYDCLLDLSALLADYNQNNNGGDNV